MPSDALHAALAMRHRLDDLFGESLALSVGVESGEVVVGRAPEGPLARRRRAHDCGATRPGAEPATILVGERTAAPARSAFEFGPPGTVDVEGELACRPLVRELALIRTKGVGRPPLSVRRPGRASSTSSSSLYRRTAEERTAAARDGDGRRRRRQDEARARALGLARRPSRPEPLRRTGRCLPYGRGTTYRPLADVLREHLGLLETDVARRSCAAGSAGREILGLTLGLDVAPDLHPLAAREELQAAWVELLTELSAERPDVMLVEDLHWAQEPLLDLLERLLDDVDGPVFCSSRRRGPELAAKHPAWGRRRRRGDDLAGAAVRRGVRAPARRAARRRRAGRAAACRARARRGQPLLPRGAPRRRPRPLASARDRRPRLGAGRARRARSTCSRRSTRPLSRRRR